MAFVFEMPEVGEGVVEAEIAEWLVEVGEVVAVDQPLCEITTDKASLEISSPKAGRLVKVYGAPGDIVGVHTPLAEIDLDAEGAAPAPPAATQAAPATPPEPTPSKAPAPAAPSPAPVAPAAPPPAPASAEASDPATRGLTKATPAVRRHARELDIDVSEVPGTGPGGRVSHDDLARFQQDGASTSAERAIAPPALPQAAPSVADQRIPIRGVRRRIAERMQAAKQTAPHFTYVEEVDCTKLVEVRTLLKPRAAERGIKLTYIPFIAKACSIAFRDFPNVNATMDEEANELVVRGAHHFGISVDTPNGLVVPVIRDVQTKSILQLAAEMQELFARTRDGKARLEELSGSTFTITSVGSIGGVLATPILNVPEVGILGVNQIKKKAVVLDDDSIAVRHRTYLSPSFDHRVIDGAVAARFVRRLKELLENPELLLVELS